MNVQKSMRKNARSGSQSSPRAGAPGSAWTGARIRGAVKRALALALFVCAVILTVSTGVPVSENLLDSDASANLILGEKLAREGGILSTSYAYGTELFVCDVQVVYSLLFRLCGDWSLVRLWSGVILQALMLGAYALLCRQSRMSLNLFLVTGAALLLPFSVPYGRIVLFHHYYIPHVTLDFAMVGLYLGARRRLSEKAAGWKTALWICGMAVCGFISGLAGVRQLMICAAPAAVSALLGAAWREKKENALREELPNLILAAGLAAAIAAGYLVNSHVLANTYSFTSYDTQTLSLAAPARREMILQGLLTALGYEEGVELFTAQGLLAVGAMGAMLIALCLSLMTFFRTQDPEARFVCGYFVSSLAVITCVFLFLGKQEFLYELYYLPVIVWMIPALGRADARVMPAEKMNLRGLSGAESPTVGVRSLTAIMACGLLIAHGVFYTGFFRNPEASGGAIRYSGLNVERTDTVATLTPVADYLTREGYTLCYASYWDGGVITELSDGNVKTVAVEPTGRRKPLRYYAWMADKNLWQADWAAGQKACLLVDFENLGSAIEDILRAVDGLEEKTAIGGYTVYELTDPAAIAKMLE